MKRILVTGATGFVGSALCDALSRSGYLVRAALRTDRPLPSGISERTVVGDIGAATEWDLALRDVDTVMHVAARVHVLHDAAGGESLYAATNTLGTQRLVNAAVQARVRRFIFLSSVKVNGEETNGRAYTAADEPRPRDAYGVSKWLAEKAVREAGMQSAMEAIIVRPPLVYGPGVRANFLRLLQWVDRGWPLPLGRIANRRSLVSLWNLCDLLVNLVTNPAAPGRTWMVCDGEDLSTPELIRRIGAAMRQPVRLLPVPVTVLRAAGALTGRRAEVARLCGSLTVDAAPTREQLGWSAPLTVDDALARTVEWYRSAERARGT